MIDTYKKRYEDAVKEMGKRKRCTTLAQFLMLVRISVFEKDIFSEEELIKLWVETVGGEGD